MSVQCVSGRSNVADFTFSTGAVCDQSFIAIKILAAICAVFNLICTFFTLRVLFCQFRRGRKFSDPLILFPFFMMVYSVWILAFSVLKAINPERIIGRDTSVTVTISSAFCFVTIGWYAFVVNLGHFFKMQARSLSTDAQKRIAAVFEVYERALPILVVLSFLSGLSILIILAAPNLVGIFLGISFTSIFVAWGCSAVTATLGLHQLASALKTYAVLDESSNGVSANSSLQKLYKFAVLGGRLVAFSLPPFLVLFLVFAFWPGPRRQITIFILVVFVTQPFYVCTFNYMFAPSNAFVSCRLGWKSDVSILPAYAPPAAKDMTRAATEKDPAIETAGADAGGTNPVQVSDEQSWLKQEPSNTNKLDTIENNVALHTTTLFVVTD